eukprot:5283761-Pyramimonas_sp.AAC.1
MFWDPTNNQRKGKSFAWPGCRLSFTYVYSFQKLLSWRCGLPASQSISGGQRPRQRRGRRIIVSVLQTARSNVEIIMIDDGTEGVEPLP